MNKKFSTLLASILLASAFSTVDAKRVATQAEFEDLLNTESGVLTLPAGDTELVFASGVNFEVPLVIKNHVNRGHYVLVNTSGITIKGEYGASLTGRLVLNADNVTVANLTIVNKEETDSPEYSLFFNKSAISVLSDAVTIRDNVFKSVDDRNTEHLVQGIELLPKTNTVAYTIEGNTFSGMNILVSGWPSFAVSLNQDFNFSSTGSSAQLPTYIDVTGYTTASNVAFNAASLFANNTFSGCAFDYVNQSNPDNPEYKEVRITPIVNANGRIKNAAAVQNAVSKTNANSKVVFKGTVEQFNKAMGATSTAAANVAVQCSDANVIYGTAQNPDNGLNAIMAGIKPLESTLHGYELIKNETSEYAMLIVRSNASTNGDYYAIAHPKNGSLTLTQVTANNITGIASASGSLWRMSKGQRADGAYYYEFVNQDGIVLKASGNAGTGLDGMFYPEAGALYSNGVVFNVDGGTLNDAKKNYFGLYRAGVNKLTVADLKWFEQDGFSTTIYYDYKNDGIHDAHLADNIAGNVFTGHLVPMAWDADDDKFIDFTTATSNGTEFYLKNADGDYIVAQKYATNGSLIGQSTYSFTTVSATTLAKNLSRSEDGLETLKYYGQFHAEYSYAVTDPKTLEAIDALCVNVNGEYIKLGRLDLTANETPTLVASKLTELKPILISLGSNEVVQPWDLLKKGKFYTVELVSSTNDNLKNKKGYKLAVEDDETVEWTWSPEFVKSYGNVLEGQFALTYKKNSQNVYYYVFTNRESQTTYSIPAAALYTTSKENEYRYGSEVLKIAPVAEHSESDGYETKKDLNNQKFYIGFASGVFNTTAWFAENHSGNTNHVIGLDIDKENALMFTATEHAAARKVTEENYRYTYHPSDSIYVISTLGYFNAKKVYGETKDTLKFVSYSFKNQYGEPLVYNDTDDRLESSVDKTKPAQKFALRKDVNGKLNLRKVTLNRTAKSESETHDASVMYQYLDGYYKLYAGDATNGMLSETWVYDRTENDLFVIEETAKPMYRKLANALDTVSIYRDTNAKEMLYEKNGFLGLDNTVQFDKIAPAMLADTAYVRGETYRPQYMLVVGPKVTPAGKWCEAHQSATCEHAVPTKGYVEGRYLVNLKDTAIAWDAANKHKEDNPYVNTTSEKYYRLGFVQATHKDDVLAIAAAKPTAKDTIFVGDDKFNVAKFALRYVDQEAGSFVIETANYKTLDEDVDAGKADGEGYIKWMNGVVVVVPEIQNAEIFNMNEDETGNPTANESIAAEGVQVIAGKGVVTVQGAAGKVVTVANILGQTIANQVAASDNVTIAAPAGVLVVTVDGEATKVVVK